MKDCIVIIRRRVICIASITLLTTSRVLLGAVTIDRLRCEYLENPLGIDVGRPRLSWILNSEERGERQTAYQILVASSREILNGNTGDLWDTGQVESDDSIQIAYRGKPLASHDECFWKVRAWDKSGRPLQWSSVAKWSMGLLSPDDWKAKWIGLDGDSAEPKLTGTNWIWFPEGEPAVAVPIGTRFFRRTVELPAGRTLKRARLRFTGDNEAHAYVNGGDVGARDNFTYVKDADVTARLKPGKNEFAVGCKNSGTEPNPAAFTAMLTLSFEEGEPLTIKTDESWKTADQEVEGWNKPGFDDSKWVAAKLVGPVGIAPWGEVASTSDRRLPARWLRKEFAVDKDIRRANVYFSGLGLSELYLNGSKVGDHVLSPGMTEYPRRSLYVTYDVTDRLRRGENAMGVVLGNGRFYSPRSKAYANMASYGFPKLLLRLRIEYTDGSVSDVASDESWKLSTDGPIIANNEFDGEEYDARKEFQDWSRVGFDDSAWQPAGIVEKPSQIVSAEMIEPIRVTETLSPVAVHEPKRGMFVFDLGQNMVGWCRLTVSGPAGAAVTLRHAETLNPDGTLYLANIRGARATDVYTLKGEGTEIWEPRFTYHGFRYVEVTGLPEHVAASLRDADASFGETRLLEGRVVHDDVEPVGKFACSNPLLNQIFKNVQWGVRGNYRSVPTDCPQRDERQGWLGDRSEESRGEMYLFDVAALYSKWLQDMEDSQKPNGSVADVSPAHWPIYSDNVTWPSSMVTIPNSLHRQYGDARTIARHYDSAKKWIDFMLTFVKDGITQRDQYGDWCVPPEDPKLIHSVDPQRITSKALMATSYLYYDLCLMARYAAMIGKTEDAERFGKQAEELKTAFNAKLFNRELGQYENGTQTSCVLPLYFGLVPQDQQQRVFDHLVGKITNETHGHIGTGLIGGQFLNRVLSDRGRADLSYTMANQKDYPSWGYMVGQGATTIWELWNGDTADPAMNSGNHVMLVGDLIIWLNEYVAGIRPDEAGGFGFKKIVMRPHPVGDLTFVDASLRSPHGLIASHWRQEGEAFDWQITVPTNTTATVFVPATNADAVTESGKPITEVEDVKFLGMDRGDYVVFAVGSGSYHFLSK